MKRKLFVLLLCTFCFCLLCGCNAKPAAKFSDPFTEAKDGQWIQYKDCKVRFISRYEENEKEIEMISLVPYSDTFVFQRNQIIIGLLTFDTSRYIELLDTFNAQTLDEKPIEKTFAEYRYYTSYEAIVDKVFINNTDEVIYEDELIRIMASGSIKINKGYRLPEEGDRYYLLMISNSNIDKGLKFYDFYKQTADYYMGSGHYFLWPLSSDGTVEIPKEMIDTGEIYGPDDTHSYLYRKLPQEEFEAMIKEKIERYCIPMEETP